MSKVTALISGDRPVVRIYSEGSDDYAEIWFETQSDANVAVERMNELFKKATELKSRRRQAADVKDWLDGTSHVTLGALIRSGTVGSSLTLKLHGQAFRDTT
jgi:hypothetical protein